MPTRNVNLTAEQDAFIDEIVRSGKYPDANAAMRDAVRSLELRLKEDDIKRDQLRTQLKAGLDALDRGAFSEVDDTALDSLVDRQLNPDILPDVLESGLKVVFCGTAVGRFSREAKSYYAHSNNKFWGILAETGLTDRKLGSNEFSEVIRFGIGLTDLCKDTFGSDGEVRPKPQHREILKKKIGKFQPTFLAFTSLEAGKRYFGHKVKCGLQSDRIQNTLIYVLPSTSLMAAWNWEANKRYWHEFAHLARTAGRQNG